MSSKATTLKEWKGSLTQGGKLLSLQLISFAMGFFMARSRLLNQTTPLGVAFTAGVGGEYTVTAALGALLGYLIPQNGLSNIRYMGAVGVVAVAVFLLGNFFKPSQKPLFTAITAGSGLLFILLILKLAGESVHTFPEILGESLLTAGCGFFFSTLSQGLKKGYGRFTPAELAACVIGITLLLTGLNGFTLFDFSPARTLSTILVLLAARYGRESAGSVTGVAFGFSVYLSDPSLLLLSLGITLGGLMAGVFSPLGKPGCAIAFLLTNGLMALQNPSYTYLPFLYEMIVACCVFFFLPEKIRKYFSNLFSAHPGASLTEGIRNSVVMRLAFASDALQDVSQTVEEVSGKLKKINAPSFEQVFHKTEDTACMGCSMRIYCWESNKGETLSALLSATKTLRKQGRILSTDLPEGFGDHCIRQEKLLNALTHYFNEYLAREGAQRRLEEIRGVIAEQFEGIAQMLSGLSEEFQTANGYHADGVNQIASILHSLEITPLDINCMTDCYGRMTAEIRVSKENDTPLPQSVLLRELSQKCQRDFEIPTIAETENTLLITLTEKAEYTVDFGVSQRCYQNNKLCGDAYQGFFDGRGRFVMIISDGMGKGGRAAVDGTMASGLMARLIKAGFHPDSALKIVNAAMIYKSTDESLATVDVTVLDLFSGITEFYKAGAPATLLRRNQKGGTAGAGALPAGILNGVSFHHSQTTLYKGDIVVMVSDGALGDGTDWITVELETWKKGDAAALAEHLADYAARRCPEGQQDDITVAVAIIESSY